MPCEDVESCARLGTELYQEEDYAGAVVMMLAAYDFEPVDVLLYNIARAFQHAGDCDSAREYFQAYLATEDSHTRSQSIEHLAELLDTCVPVGGATDPSILARVAARHLVVMGDSIASDIDQRLTALAELWDSAQFVVGDAVETAQWETRPSPIQGTPAASLDLFSDPSNAWFERAEIERDDGGQLFVFVSDRLTTLDEACYSLEDSDQPPPWVWGSRACDDPRHWVLDSSQEKALEELMAGLTHVALSPSEPDLVAFDRWDEEGNRIWVTFVGLPAGGEPTVIVQHEMETTVTAGAASHMWVSDLDEDAVPELVVLTEAFIEEDGGVSEELLFVFDLSTYAIQLQTCTVCHDRDEWLDTIESRFSIGFDGAPSDLLEQYRSSSGCPDVRTEVVGEPEGCTVSEHERRWAYDAISDSWAPIE